MRGLLGEDLMTGGTGARPMSTTGCCSVDPSVVRSIPFSRQSWRRRKRLRLAGGWSLPPPPEMAPALLLPSATTTDDAGAEAALEEGEAGGSSTAPADWARASVRPPAPVPPTAAEGTAREVEVEGAGVMVVSSWLWLML